MAKYEVRLYRRKRDKRGLKPGWDLKDFWLVRVENNKSEAIKEARDLAKSAYEDYLNVLVRVIKVNGREKVTHILIIRTKNIN
jgi:hypothetical protein